MVRKNSGHSDLSIFSFLFFSFFLLAALGPERFQGLIIISTVSF